MRLLTALPLMLVACGSTEPSVSAEMLGQTATADLSETLDHIEELYFSVQDRHRGDIEEPTACVDAVGTCTWCAQWQGDLPLGSFSAQPVAVPCGGERLGDASDVAYTVDAGWLEGSWVQADGAWVLSALGGRSASVEARTEDEDDPTVDASWTIDQLSVTYEAERRTRVSATLAYDDGPVKWTVALSGVGDELVGLLHSDQGDRCTVASDPDEPTAVHCAR